MSKHSVCVYCGSRSGAKSNYLKAAQSLGKALAERDWRLVYGAGDVGLMGAVAKAAQLAGGETFGVIPEHLLPRELGKTDLTHFIVTENMHERKKIMFMNSDAIVVLPGGPGTLDEFFEVLTWAQLGLHSKPILLWNAGGYWDPLLTVLGNVIHQGFADESFSGLYEVVDDLPGALAVLEARLR